jgi:hypothetical protein
VVTTGDPYEGWDEVRKFLLNCSVRVRVIH